MAFTPTEGADTAFLVGPGSGTIDFLGGVDTLDMGEAVRSSYTITSNVDGYVHIDSVSGASSQATLHLKVKNLELMVWHDGTPTTDLRLLFDTTPPTLVSATPADSDSGAAVSSDIVFTFSETIQKAAGTVTIRDALGLTVASYAVSASNVTVAGAKLTVNPDINLSYSASYTVTLSAGSVKDAAGNALASVASTAFKTVSDPAYTGTANADFFAASPGRHIVDGGAGIDTLTLGAARSAYTLTHSGSSYTLNAGDGSSGYTMSAVERLKFSDFSVALDLDGHAGQTAKILGAVFGVDTLSNKAYAGIGLQMLDAGTSYEALIQLALDVRLGAGASNKAVVDLLYTNVIGVAPSPGEEAAFVALLENHTYSQATLAVMAADISYNTAHINLVGLFDTGLAYIPS